ncbi:hypothetical protein CVIRNUC_005077 [Coccomyxa viridis]|uniref:START domain-containing protein n=1 Tax=Coccomyxa viridis TaxID=1274662 RepID=A0AAV1I4B8_9CHLO|nr:hypothetical protein CVIRNUC_005077 [Coccomyxa viridis]
MQAVSEDGAAQQVPLLDTWIFRESTVVPGILKARRAQLFPDKFGTIGKKESVKLSQVWNLNHRYRVGALRKHKYSILHEGRNNSVVALARGQYDEKELWSFKIHNGRHIIKDTDKTTLAFNNADDARLWHQTFQSIIADLAAKQGVERRRKQSTADTPSQRPSRPRIQVTTPAGLESDCNSEFGGSPDTGTPPGLHGAVPSPFAGGASLESMNGRLGSDHSLEPPAATLPVEAHAHGLDMEMWEAWYCQDGVTVFFGTNKENRDVLMVSLIVRAPPNLVTEVLLKNEYARSASQIGLQSTKVLEKVDDSTIVFTGTWQPGGWAAALLAPREVVIKRTWRREDDGTFVVMMQSVDHPAAPAREPPFYNWRAPIRAQIEFSGYTLAPLQPHFANHDTSQETLVTHIMKADMGGWTSNSLSTRLPQPLLRWSALWHSVIRPVVHHNLMLRNRAEAERFVTRPFLMGTHDAPQAGPSPLPAGAAQRASRADSAKKRATTSVFKPAQHLDGAEEAQEQYHDAERCPDNDPAMSKPLLQQNSEGTAAGPTNGACNTGSCNKRFWSCPGDAGFKVRGPNYLRDKKKIPANDPLFALAAVDLVECETSTFHIAQHLPSLKASKAPFTFLVNIIVPGNPPFHLVMSWAADASSFEGIETLSRQGSGSMSVAPTPRLASLSHSLDEGSDNGKHADLDSPFDLSLARFLAGGDSKDALARRNNTFKLIPRVTKGSWIIKQSVGTTPCLLGNKLTTKYYQGPGYMEVDIDVGSSSVAATVVGLVQGATKSLVVDMGIVLEGHSAEELPESLLGTVRFSHLDLGTAQYLDTESGELRPRSDLLRKLNRLRSKEKNV